MDEVILIRPSRTADSRYCDDVTQVTKEQLLQSSLDHIDEVQQGIQWVCNRLQEAAQKHDHDKIEDIDGFLRDFRTEFDSDDWLQNHYKVNRHHLNEPFGCPEDVDLVDVIEMIVDCMAAGMARKGTTYPMDIDSEILQRAVTNTADKIRGAMIVLDDE